MGLPRISVHKFTSCSGCQLALLDMGEGLLAVTRQVELVHFVEAGLCAPDETVDIAFIEGSISTPEEAQRIRQVRANCRYLVTVGACATAGGIQALRNLGGSGDWLGAVYARPELIATLSTSDAIARHVKVDFELWGCPVSPRQMQACIHTLLHGALPVEEREKVCGECKRQQLVCRLVARGEPCMGPVTRTGCGALCPAFGTACYGCYGPAEDSNTQAFGQALAGLGLAPDQVARRFALINVDNETWRAVHDEWQSVAKDNCDGKIETTDPDP